MRRMSRRPRVARQLVGPLLAAPTCRSRRRRPSRPVRGAGQRGPRGTRTATCASTSAASTFAGTAAGRRSASTAKCAPHAKNARRADRGAARFASTGGAGPFARSVAETLCAFTRLEPCALMLVYPQHDLKMPQLNPGVANFSQRQKTTCKECGGSQVCPHNKMKRCCAILPLLSCTSDLSDFACS